MGGLFTWQGGTVRVRRGPFLAAARLREPRRLLIVMRLPLIGDRHVAIRLSR